MDSFRSNLTTACVVAIALLGVASCSGGSNRNDGNAPPVGSGDPPIGDPGNPPSDPGSPSDPGNPNDPGSPSNPSNPSDPGSPSDPSNPNDPGSPGDGGDDPPPGTPFGISSTLPTGGADNVARNIEPAITFSLDLDEDSVSADAVSLMGPTGEVPITTSVSGSRLTLTPLHPLSVATPYTIEIESSIRGASGEFLPAAFTTAFKTADGTWQGDAPIESIDTGNAADPKIAFDASGNAFSLWVQFNGTQTDIYANRYIAGDGWQGAVPLETDTQSATLPRLTVDAQGNAMAVWRQTVSTTQQTVQAKHYSVSTGSWDPLPIRLDRNLAHLVADVRTATDANGNVFAVWEQHVGTASELHASAFTNAAWAQQAERVDDDADNETITDIKIVAAGDRNAFAVWREDLANFPDVWSVHFSASDAWSDADRLEATDTPTTEPQVAVDRNGNAIVVWSQLSNLNVQRVLSRHYPAGGPWETAIPLDNGTAFIGSFNTEVAMDAAGNAFVAWTQIEQNAHADAWANRYTVGSGWDVQPTRLENDANSEAVWAQIRVNPRGDAVAMWSDQQMGLMSNHFTAGGQWGEAVPAGVPGVFPNLPFTIDASGNALLTLVRPRNNNINHIWSGRLTVRDGWNATVSDFIDSGANAAASPALATDAQGNSLAVWVQSDGTRDNIESARFE